MNSKKLFFAHLLFGLLPPTRAFGLKSAILRWCGAQVGENVRIVSSARFQLTGHLAIGDDSWIGHDVLIVGGDADVSIGSRVDIGPRATIVTGGHELAMHSSRAAGLGYSSPITIGDGAWLGAACTILGGVNVGASSVVAAGALVIRHVPSQILVGGVPAQVLRQDGDAEGKDLG